jgi:hypothetical protein
MTGRGRDGFVRKSSQTGEARVSLPATRRGTLAPGNGVARRPRLPLPINVPDQHCAGVRGGAAVSHFWGRTSARRRLAAAPGETQPRSRSERGAALDWGRGGRRRRRRHAKRETWETARWERETGGRRMGDGRRRFRARLVAARFARRVPNDSRWRRRGRPRPCCEWPRWARCGGDGTGRWGRGWSDGGGEEEGRWEDPRRMKDVVAAARCPGGFCRCKRARFGASLALLREFISSQPAVALEGRRLEALAGSVRVPRQPAPPSVPLRPSLARSGRRLVAC